MVSLDTSNQCFVNKIKEFGKWCYWGFFFFFCAIYELAFKQLKIF